MTTGRDYDVAIVGASLAGCTAAAELARQGLQVALIERHAEMNAYKRACTHFIQPSATPVLERLGLAPLIEAAGGIRNGVELWTRYGWVAAPGAPHGYSIRRQRLDPMVREHAAATRGVALLTGATAVGAIEDHGRVVGVEIESRAGEATEIRARLVVAADGRASRMADLTGVPAKSRPNRRITYWSYFRDLPLQTGTVAQFWFGDPRIAYALPNDDGVTLVAVWEPDDRLADVKRDIDAHVRRTFAALPDAPDLDEGERISPWLGKVNMPNLARRPVHRGMALIGDAALASDPVWGVGCGFALQSAVWLADLVGPALGKDTGMDLALKRYARTHRRALMAHHRMICDYSTGRRFRAVEKLMFAAAARDERTAKHLHGFASRRISVPAFLSPRAIGRAASVLVRARARRDPMVAPVMMNR
jgi:2-polyprenyl-6-methoxyphenol hydroxylase-like FAD-dependent oxidoreductase